MTENDATEMPWAGIVKVTAAATAVVGLLLTALSAAAVRQARREKEESERFVWTDKNRWE
jgi:hypothetical protein